MIFEVTQIRNGWEVKGSWIEPGGGDYHPRPLIETLYCRDIATAASLQVHWATSGFDEAFRWLQEQNSKKEN